MVRVALLSRVTFTTATLINRYCIDFYTYFSRLLPAPGVRSARGGKRPSGSNHLHQHQLTRSTTEPGRASSWQRCCPDGACACCATPAGKRAARRVCAARPDPQSDNTHYASPNPPIA